MTVEQMLKTRIIEEYGTLSSFVEKNGLNYSTVDSILKRGILNSNINNVIKICKALHISTDALAEGRIEPVMDDRKSQSIDVARFVQMLKFALSNSRDVNLDGKPLSDAEADFLTDSLSLVIEQMRKRREK